jgi:hypothetical protein
MTSSCHENIKVPDKKNIPKTQSMNSFDLGDTTANVKELIFYNRVQYSLLENLPQYLKKFIPKGYGALDIVSADLNIDGINDFLLASFKIDEAKINPSPKRNLKILLGQPDHTFKLDCESWTVLVPLDMGGFSDPYPGIIVDKGTFVIQFSGGSNWKETAATTFKYSRADKDWIQTKEITESYFMDKRQYESDTLTAKEFGRRSFKKNYCK